MSTPHTAGNPAVIEASFTAPTGLGALTGTTATVIVVDTLGVATTVDDPVVTIDADVVSVSAIWSIPDAAPQGVYVAKVETEGPLEAYTEQRFYVKAQYDPS
jgi:hypothetical protein